MAPAISPDQEVPSWGQLVSSMLSASPDRVFARASGSEGDSALTETYWSRGKRQVLLQSRGVADRTHGDPTAEEWETETFTRDNADLASRRGPSWLGWIDRMLQPGMLYIWGRRGEDWRFDDTVGWDTDRHLLEISIVRESPLRRGRVFLDCTTGYLMEIQLPGLVHCTIEELDTNPSFDGAPEYLQA